MDRDRHRWTEGRRRKQPSLYDEYLNEERPANQSTSHANLPTSSRNAPTIRSVTPDSGTDEAIVRPPTTQTFEREFLALSSSPVTSPRLLSKEHGSGGSPKISNRGQIGRRESTDNTGRREGPGSPKVSGSRRRTMTLQESISDQRAPAQPKGRVRMSSEQHVGSASMSNGHGLPSSVSQPAMGTAHSNQYVLRPKSSASNSISSMNGPLPTPNARRILHLMKTLCGRTSGNALIRKSPRSAWMTAYCFIRDAEGSLMYETEYGDGSHKTLIPDLRGCQVRCVIDEETQTPYIEVAVARASLEVHIRVPTQSELDSWFAALLCWSPMQPRGIHNRLAKPQAAHLSARPADSTSRQNSEASLLKDAAVIKVGNMVYWDTDVTFTPHAPVRGSSRGSAQRNPSFSISTSYGLRWWKRVSCTLRENGELKFRTDAEGQHLSTVQLSDLSRSAIQRLDPSVLEIEHCIAIYPQYTAGQTFSDSARPIFLSLESSVLFEVWFVLLRAFTIPQLYGPRPAEDEQYHHVTNRSEGLDKLAVLAHADMFRMERGLSLCILEAKLHSPQRTKNSPDPSGYGSRHTSTTRSGREGGFYVEVHLDGETRGKTLVKQSEANPFWSQEFEYVDLPAVLSSASVYLKHSAGDLSGQKGGVYPEAYGLAQDPTTSSALSGYTGITQDTTVGKVEIILEELDTQKRNESWWPIVNSADQEVGSMLIRARADETVILMRREYEGMHDILHAFENGLTVQISQVMQSDLKRLSDSLVNIFQVSNRSTDWLMALVEDEIDGLGKDTPLSKARYNQRLGSAESETSGGQRGNDRELVVRDMNKNAALEANLLFRGNTLLTKALDTHMRRVGADYLSAALGRIIRSINERDPDCEVDPNKVTNANDMSRNWTRLMSTTGDVWNSIRTSAQKCPVDLRFIFRHIKACAEDRYGDFLRTVSYSSVSGFLFLRFFCPAVLSPKLFGLLKEDPKPRAKRTFVLIAKSLQTMANMATFGSKEPWMEPMNSFLNSNREDFKKFIEEVCYVPHPPAALADTVPAYSTPNQIRNRLPPTSKEGFPSLPFLLDEGREYANLVEFWLHSSFNANFDPSRYHPNSAIVLFDAICKTVHNRTKDCLARAERAERPTSELSLRWEEIIDSLSSTSGLDNAIPTPHSHPPTPKIDTDVATLTSLTSNVTPTSSATTLAEPFRGRTSTDTDPDRGGITPIALVRPHLTDPDPSSPLSPHRRAQRDWESAPDGGAASAAASLLSQDRNPRAGFILPSSTSGSILSHPPSTSSTRPNLLGQSFARTSHDDLRNAGGLTSSREGGAISASATVSAGWTIPHPQSPQWSGGLPPLPTVPFSPSIGADSDISRPASALSRNSDRSGWGQTINANPNSSLSPNPGHVNGHGQGAGGLGMGSVGNGSLTSSGWGRGSEGDLSRSFDEPKEGDTALPAYNRDKARRLEKERKRRGSRGESGGKGVRELFGGSLGGGKGRKR
ncbi:putative GTPase-activating protein 6 [Elsinoe fawcettii]|nr:putative GTPase-activating protein 6 [Elsinoe fawcettii]